LCLDGDVQAEMGSSQIISSGLSARRGDANALALAAGEFVWEAVAKQGSTARYQQLCSPLMGLLAARHP